MPNFTRVAKLKTAEQFVEYLGEHSIDLPFDRQLLSGVDSPLNQSLNVYGQTLGNRFCVLPMEGWDATVDGLPSDLTRRRWRRFGASGAKLIWGGEAVAVRRDGRANPNQLLILEDNLSALEQLRGELVNSHAQRFGNTEDLSVGLQLTHSGRFARPNAKAKLEPRTAYQHPVLDKKFSINAQQALLSDDELARLIDDFIDAAVRAEKIGFSWVDIKHCHGYLGHELLSGYDRPGKFGGAFENRTRFLKDIVSGVRGSTRGLQIGVRLSMFDFVPFAPDEQRVGQPLENVGSRHFGSDQTGTGVDLEEPNQFVSLMKSLGIDLLCTTAGSPYYNPHITRPAALPPSDGYLPPEDPLVGVSRQIQATGTIKKQHPNMVIVGSGYSYLQEWLPNVGQAAVNAGLVDSVGMGRMVLSYPDLPADVLAGNTLARKKICRTFSDCTTAPRNGLVSGCYPLDSKFKNMPEYQHLVQIKRQTPNRDA